jgi:hypothetical protein
MTTPPAVYAQFGMALAFAEQTLTERLHEHLANPGTEPETWYTLQLVATRGPALAREELSDALERSSARRTSTSNRRLTCSLGSRPTG